MYVWKVTKRREFGSEYRTSRMYENLEDAFADAKAFRCAHRGKGIRDVSTYHLTVAGDKRIDRVTLKECQ